MCDLYGNPQPSGQHRQVSDKRQQWTGLMPNIRKHRSLDGTQFLHEFNSQVPISPPPPAEFFTTPADPYSLDRYAVPYSYISNAGTDISGCPVGQGYDEMTTQVYPPYGKLSAAMAPSPYLAVESDNFRRRSKTLNNDLNYMTSSIRSFWPPELKQETRFGKDTSSRMQNFEDKIMNQAAEINKIRLELDRRGKDINELIAGSEFLGMDDELRRLVRKHVAEDHPQHQYTRSPKNFTDKSITTSEFQTMKMKLERSEMALTDKCRELQNSEMRLTNMTEQNKELEKRIEILVRSNVNNDAQIRLLHDDVNMLRSKLESRNQLIDSKGKSIKLLEEEVDSLKQQLQESGHGISDHRHRIGQQQQRIDQLDSLLRERDTEIDRLKQRLLQEPSTILEHDLQQRIENLEFDNRTLQEMVDLVRQNSDVEKQKQLRAFEEETGRLNAAIDSLQTELANRHILLASQNEKISQLDSNERLSTGNSVTNKFKHNTSLVGHYDAKFGKQHEFLPIYTSKDSVQTELDEARKEVESLLRTVQNLQNEKSSLQNKLLVGRSADQYVSSESSAGLGVGEKSETSLKIRIDELEEALRESVDITAERDKQLNEQKNLIQQLSAKVSVAFKDPTRRLQGTGKTDIEQKALDEERQRCQRQIVNLRKEVTMAAIREKDVCIHLLQSPPESIKDKVEILTRQKEQLRHRLLTQNNEQYSVCENGPYTGNVLLAAQQQQQIVDPLATTYEPAFHQRTAPITATGYLHSTFTSNVSPSTQPLINGNTVCSLATGNMQTNTLQRTNHCQYQPYAEYVSAAESILTSGSVATSTATIGRASTAVSTHQVAGTLAGELTTPMSVAIPSYVTIPSAPASFTYGPRGDDEGIWA